MFVHWVAIGKPPAAFAVVGAAWLRKADEMNMVISVSEYLILFSASMKVPAQLIDLAQNTTCP